MNSKIKVDGVNVLELNVSESKGSGNQYAFLIIDWSDVTAEEIKALAAKQIAIYAARDSKIDSADWMPVKFRDFSPSKSMRVKSTFNVRKYLDKPRKDPRKLGPEELINRLSPEQKKELLARLIGEDK